MSTLKSMGLTNADTEDLGTLATASAKMEYNYYCSSFACAGNKNEVLKFTTVDWFEKCKDCGGLLHSKRARLKHR